MWRSLPMVVTGPWPGWTTVSSGRRINFERSESMICSMEPPHRSVRPMLPANKVSPEKSCGAGGRSGAPSSAWADFFNESDRAIFSPTSSNTVSIPGATVTLPALCGR